MVGKKRFEAEGVHCGLVPDLLAGEFKHKNALAVFLGEVAKLGVHHRKLALSFGEHELGGKLLKAGVGDILGHGGLRFFLELGQHCGASHDLGPVVGRELKFGCLADAFALLEGHEEFIEVLLVEVKAVFALEAVDIGLL